MILSAGLTPAWQQILVFDSFRCGEVNRAAEAVRLGMAAAAENLRELLPCRLDAARVQQRAHEVRVEQCR